MTSTENVGPWLHVHRTVTCAGLIMYDLMGGDYGFTFVDAPRWQAICSIEEDDLESYNNAVLALCDRETVAPGEIIADFSTQAGVIETVNRLGVELLGIVSLRLT